MDPTDNNEEGPGGLDRRSVLKRGAVLGGALVWTVPAVQTIAGPAFAAGSPRCDAVLEGSSGGVCTRIRYEDTAQCCDCISGTYGAFPLPIAIALCAAFTGDCVPLGPPEAC